jgi:magnesium chelatase subunit D
LSPFDPDWADDSAPQGAEFCDSVWAATLLAIDPTGLGGILLRAWSGPARDGFVKSTCALLAPGTPVKKMPLNISDERMLGGLDLAATLRDGKPVMLRGLLSESSGGLLIAAMAERLTPHAAARICAAMDRENDFTVLALDEGIGADEAPPPALLERLAFTINTLPGENEDWPAPHRVAAARGALPDVSITDAIVEQICGIAAALGVDSLRAPLFALRAARALAALNARAFVEPEDVALAVRLVLVPRATRVPSAPDEQPEEQEEEPPEPQEAGAEKQNEAVEDSVAEAEKAVLPPELLAALAAGLGPRRMARGAGKSGTAASMKRGRPAGVRPGQLGGHARLSLLETLRAAAPWQPIRRAMPDRPGDDPLSSPRHAGEGRHPRLSLNIPASRKMIIRPDDVRIKKFKENARTIAIFAVDASGSSAVNRLAEAKGAIQLLLADCYVRRDQVALLAFRGREAELLLPPTHALARAKRSLAGLPGGGPTPLATGINAARALAEAERRKGHKPLLVLLTDGGANVGRDGKPGRAAAAADALASGKSCRGAGIASLVVDTAPRPNAFVAKLAGDMGAKYLPLPYADPAKLSRAVQAEGGKNVRIA